jgi:cyclic pyranopterin phosphate synthase
MVDVGDKPLSRRWARAQAVLVAQPTTLDRLLQGDVPKGEALAAASLAGVQAAKRTDEIIPLCHSLPLEHVGVAFERQAPDRLRVTATASLTARTGVEMEALTAACVACLTLYDMAKAIDKGMSIEAVRLLEKHKQPA